MSYARFLLTLLIMAGWTMPAQAQQWQWPEDPENLKVLPEDISVQDLRATMVGFSTALGVRCHHCHDDANGRRLSEIDFASDAKPEKEKARVMLRMVEAINTEHLAELDVPAHERLTVTCLTCHRGLPRPVLLEDVLVDLVPAHGVDSTITSYRALREAHYGGFAYDFSEPVLLRVAGELAEDALLDDALEILALNLEMYPNSWRTHFAFGELYLQQGDEDAARKHYEAVLALNPNHPVAQQRLEALGGQ